MVKAERKCDFSKALELIAKWIGFKEEDDIEIQLPFSGFYKKIIKQTTEPEDVLVEYDKNILPPEDSYSYKFVKDGISVDVQRKLGIRYSHNDDSILIPIYDYNGRFVGVKARNNSDKDFSKRWYAWMSYSKTQVLYGWNVNYDSIIKKNTLFVVESEKSVAQLMSMGIHNSVAIGGHSISETQAKYIKALNVDKILVLFDEGIDKEEIEYEANKLKVNNNFKCNKVGYVYDWDNKFLVRNSKDSPTDNGYEIFKKLVKERKQWLEN